MRSIRRRLAACALLVLALPVAAWQWPVPQPAITGTFGQDGGGYFLRGVEISGGAQPVFPVDDGVVVAVHADRESIASGLGTYVVVEHDQAFRSIYAHLEAGELPLVGSAVGPESRIGVVGDTGQVPRRVLRLFIIDLERGEYVNPVLLLPDLPDSVRPTIAGVFARGSQSLYDLRRSASLPAGTYELSAEVYDRLASGPRDPRVSPYSIRTFVSGQEAFAVAMDRIVVDEEGSSVFPGAIAAERLYTEEGAVRLGQMTVGVGTTQVEVVAADFAGNETSWSVSLTAESPATETDATGDGTAR